MNMLFVLSLCVQCGHCFGLLLLSTNSTSWIDAIADDKCKLAGKNNTQNNTYISTDFFANQDEIKENRAWIGAHIKRSKWIDFKGCKQAGIPRAQDQMPQGITSDIYVSCIKQCGNIFVLYRDACYCKDTFRYSDSDSNCDGTPCNVFGSELDGFGYCGTPAEGRKAFCVCEYEVLENEISESGGDAIICDEHSSPKGDCVSVSYDYASDFSYTPRFHIRDCNSTQRGQVCTDVLSYTNGMWLDSFDICEENNQQFQGYVTKNEIAFFKQSGEFWIAVRRISYFNWGPILTNDENFTYECVSVKWDGKELESEYQKCDNKLLSICNHTSEDTTTIPPDRTTQKPFDTSQSQTILSEKLQRPHPARSSNLTVTAVIATVVCVCFIFIIAIVLIILKFKGKWHSSPLELFRSSNPRLMDDNEPPSRVISTKPQYDSYDLPFPGSTEGIYDDVNVGHEIYNEVQRHGHSKPTIDVDLSDYDTMASIAAANNQEFYDKMETSGNKEPGIMDENLYDTVGVPR